MVFNKFIVNDIKESYRFLLFVSFYLSYVYMYVLNIKLYMFINLRFFIW